MSVTIPLGWWLLPLTITVIALGGYMRWTMKQEPSYGYGAIGQSLADALVLMLAIIASLVAWLVWALIF